MSWYRLGEPGADCYAHLCTRGRRSSGQCVAPRFEKDDPKLKHCARMSVALCDAPGCDRPMCEKHRTKHATKANTDFCPLHRDKAAAL